MDELIEQLRAVAEPTRLRIVVALESCELTVSEICAVLGQTQPAREQAPTAAHRRWSAAAPCRRHTTPTTGSGLRHEQRPPRCDRPADRLIRTGAPARPGAAGSDPVLASRPSGRVFRPRRRRVGPASRDARSDLGGRGRNARGGRDPVVDSVLDIGTGTGRILEVFADRTARGLGVDLSRQMLRVARSRLDDDRFRHCSVRQGDIYDLDVARRVPAS